MAYLNTTFAPSFFDRTRSILAALKARRAQNKMYRKTMRELGVLSDRELADLGLSRCDLHHIARETSENHI